MSKIDLYRQALRSLSEWEPYLLAESGLPGPRGNLELAQAAACEGDAAQFERLRAYTPERAPVNTPEEFLAFCGVLGLGRLAAEGKAAVEDLRPFASDPRWRTREAVAMGLQKIGDADMERLLQIAADWAGGNMLERRAAAAGVCEPRLLANPAHARQALALLGQMTASLLAETERKSPEFQALKKALGYCWSVAAAALPEEGKAAMEAWFPTCDPDLRCILRENLKKNRLIRIEKEWVEKSLLALG